MTDRSSKLMRVADRFRQGILSGLYLPGDRLPTDEDIAREFGINKRTVAGGLARLVAEGLITRAPGRGSVVVREKIVSKHTNVVDCIAMSSGAIFANMEKEITLQSLKRGFQPVWIPPSLFWSRPVDENHKQFLQYMENCVNAMPYGMIVYGERFIPYEMLERNLAKTGKLVFICCYVHTREIPAKYVLIDYDAAAKNPLRFSGRTDTGKSRSSPLLWLRYGEHSGNRPSISIILHSEKPVRKPDWNTMKRFRRCSGIPFRRKKHSGGSCGRGSLPPHSVSIPCLIFMPGCSGSWASGSRTIFPSSGSMILPDRKAGLPRSISRNT